MSRILIRRPLQNALNPPLWSEAELPLFFALDAIGAPPMVNGPLGRLQIVLPLAAGRIGELLVDAVITSKRFENGLINLRQIERDTRKGEYEHHRPRPQSSRVMQIEQQAPRAGTTAHAPGFASFEPPGQHDARDCRDGQKGGASSRPINRSQRVKNGRIGLPVHVDFRHGIIDVILLPMIPISI